MFSKEHLAEIQAEKAKLLSERAPYQTQLASQLKREIREIERQSSDLASMLSEVKHRRPLIQRIDTLEDERETLKLRLSDLEEIEEPEFCSYTEAELVAFDGEELRLVPNLATLTRVKMASARGVTPKHCFGGCELGTAYRPCRQSEQGSTAANIPAAPIQMCT